MTLIKTANRSEVTVSGHKVEIHKGGSGPALLWLHGGEGGRPCRARGRLHRWLPAAARSPA